MIATINLDLKIAVELSQGDEYAPGELRSFYKEISLSFAVSPGLKLAFSPDPSSAAVAKIKRGEAPFDPNVVGHFFIEVQQVVFYPDTYSSMIYSEREYDSIDRIRLEAWRLGEVYGFCEPGVDFSKEAAAFEGSGPVAPE